MTQQRRRVGAWGEDRAVSYLAGAGMTVLDRNWRCRHGELDIVAVDGDCLVVVEVKTRRSRAFGTALEAVDAHKLARLRMLTGQWLASHQVPTRRVRIDVVALQVDAGSVTHLRGVG